MLPLWLLGFSASDASAWGGRNKNKAIKEFMIKADREYDEALKDPAVLKTPGLADMVRKAKAVFDADAKDYLNQPKYRDWEVDYVRDSARNEMDGIKFILAAAKESNRLGETGAQRDERMQAAKAMSNDQRAHSLELATERAQKDAKEHPEVAAVLKSHEGHPRQDGGEKIGGDEHARVGGEQGGDGGEHAVAGGEHAGGDRGHGRWEDQNDVDIRNSDAVRLQDHAIQAVNDPAHAGQGGNGGIGGGGPNSGGASGGASGASSGGSSGGAGAGSGSASGAGGSNFGDSVQSGASQALAAAGSSALDAGHFSDAADQARQALSLDPTNQEALMVLHSAQGRVEGGGAAGPAAAAGAGGLSGSAQGFSGGGGERGGGASFASAARGPALAASGPSRASTEQAVKAAENALSLRDPAGALAQINRGLAGDQNNPALLAERAKIYGRMGNYKAAAADAAKGLEFDPKNKELLRAKAFANLRSGDYSGAAASANQLIELDPKDGLAYALRGHAFGNMRNSDAMASDLAKAASLDPRFQDLAAKAAAGRLQLPADSDVLFLFPGETSARGSAGEAAPAERGRRFGALVAVSAFGGLLLALGLLQTVLAPLKAQVSSVFTRITRTGPSVAALPEIPDAASGSMAGLIRGQYEITRQIGQGGMGTVYEGTDRSLGRKVAIKKMRDELRINPQERARFVIEAKTVAALHHPNIVDIYAIAEDADDVYLIFEYVDGKTVHELVQRSGRLPVDAAARVTRAAADALTYAHSRGVIHRDMKPSNMMIDGSGRVKVMDFGIARMAKDAMTRYSMTNTVVGTPPYMAPEQEQGQVRRESDVYALAVCAYEMLTGKLPFIGTGGGMLLNKINMSYVPPSRETAGLPETLDPVFERAFQADPEKRFRTPQEFADALERSLPTAGRIPGVV